MNSFGCTDAKSHGETLRVAGYFGSCNLDMLYLLGGLELCALSRVSIKSRELFHGITLVSEDAMFGVSCQTEPLIANTPYQVEVVSPAHNFDYILDGERILWKEPASFAESKRTFVFVPQSGGPATLTFLRHRKHACESRHERGEFVVRSSFDVREQGGEFPEIAPPLELSLAIQFQLKAMPGANVPSSRTLAVSHLRRWRSPRIYREMPLFLAAREQPVPVSPAPYPTDYVDVIENHELYLQLQKEWGVDPVATLESRMRLVDSLGIQTMAVCLNPDFVAEFKRLRSAGIGRGIQTVVYSVPMPPQRSELTGEQVRKEFGRINNFMNRHPELRLLLRGTEINTNGEWQVRDVVPGYLTSKEAAGREPFWTRRCFRQQFEELFHEYRQLLKRPERCTFYMQGDGPVPGGSDYYRYGFEFFTAKNIHRMNTNVVIAFTRGIARAFQRKIGLAYDSWIAGYYCMTNPLEVEHIFRSYYWSGAEVVDYEAQFLGTSNGRDILCTEAGAAFYRWVNFTRTHPRRGKQIIRIGYIKGSDDLGIRPTAPGGSRYGIRRDILQADHPAMQDWDLLDVAFPDFGNYEASNQLRYLTGTPYGAADVLPWDAPLEHLRSFHVLVMTGKNRLSQSNLANYKKFVREGGTLVLALEHLLAEDQYAQKYLLEAQELIGAQLGEDNLIDETHYDRIWPSSSRFYNRVRNVQGNILKRLPNGEPLLIESDFGKGLVYFFTTEYLTTSGRTSVDHLLRALFEESRAVSLSPDNGWIQQDLFQRDGIVILSLINQGRVKSPTGLGKDHGPLDTEVQIDASALGLSGNIAAAQVNPAMTLEPVSFVENDGKLTFAARIEKFSEFVIGPAANLQQLFQGR